MATTLTTTEVRELLTEALYTETDGTSDDIAVSSYTDAGVLTTDEGLILRINGAEFQVTIVRSR